jgi:hypothetical protein
LDKNINNILTIKKCPCCGQIHSYELEIQTSFVMAIPSGESISKVRRNYTRLFVCPVTGNSFQAKIELIELLGQSIEAVQVKGLAK